MLTPVVLNGLLFGGVFSVFFTLVLLVIGRVNPEMMLQDYPPDVRAKHGPMSARAKRQRLLLFPFFFGGMIAISAWSVVALKQTLGLVTFGDVFLSALVMMLTFNVYDLLVLDWLMMIKLQPKFAILPGTEGLAGYNDFGFHLHGFKIGLVWSVGLALVLAGIAAFFA